MEKRKCIISKNINSDTPEIPSNRRGLHRAMHFGRKCCSLEFFSLNYTVYINIILQQVWLGLPLKKPYKIETNGLSSISRATFYVFDYKLQKCALLVCRSI